MKKEDMNTGNNVLIVDDMEVLKNCADSLFRNTNYILSNARSIDYLVKNLKNVWSGDEASKTAFEALIKGSEFLKSYVSYNREFSELIQEFYRGIKNAN